MVGNSFKSVKFLRKQNRNRREGRQQTRKTKVFYFHEQTIIDVVEGDKGLSF